MGAINGLYQADILKSWIIEIILTCVFVFTINFKKAENGNVAGLVIGLTLTLVHISEFYFAGTSANPARSFGPALFVGDLL